MSARGSQSNVLVAGESCIKHAIQMKGFDQFRTTEHEEGAGALLECLAAAGHAVTCVRGHEISSGFPRSPEESDAFDGIVISDIGSNSFLLPDETFQRSAKSPNRLGLWQIVRAAAGGSS